MDGPLADKAMELINTLFDNEEQGACEGGAAQAENPKKLTFLGVGCVTKRTKDRSQCNEKAVTHAGHLVGEKKPVDLSGSITLQTVRKRLFRTVQTARKARL